MARDAQMYFATAGGVPPGAASFPFETRGASYRSPAYAARLEKYASLVMTESQKAELSSLGLRYTPEELPALESSFVSADAKEAARNCIRTFFVLDNAYAAVGQIKNVLQWCRNNSGERVIQALTAVHNNVVGFTFRDKEKDQMLSFDDMRKGGWPGVTAPIGDPTMVKDRIITGDGAIDFRDGYMYPYMSQTQRRPAADLFIAEVLRLLKGETINATNFSTKARTLVFEYDIANPAAVGASVTAASEDARNMANFKFVQTQPVFPNGGMYRADVPDNLKRRVFPNVLKKVRVGPHTAADVEHDTLLKVVAGVLREIYDIAKVAAAAASNKPGFVTGEDHCATPGGTMAWRIPTKVRRARGAGAAAEDGNAAEDANADKEYVFLTGSRPVDAAGIYYGDSERVCVSMGEESVRTVDPGTTVPVRVSLPAGARASQRRGNGRAGHKKHH